MGLSLGRSERAALLVALGSSWPDHRAAPFRNVVDAVNQAYYWDAALLGPTARYEHSTTQGFVARPGLTMEDKITQACWILRLIRQTLGGQDLRIVQACHILAHCVGDQANEKINAIEKLTGTLFKLLNGEADRRFLMDVVTQFACHYRQCSDEQWAKILNKSPRTLHRWRYGWRNREGAVTYLDRSYGEAMERLLVPFWQKGLIRMCQVGVSGRSGRFGKIDP